MEQLTAKGYHVDVGDSVDFAVANLTHGVATSHQD